MKSVFVVENGEKHEGGEIVSVHRTYKTAKAVALSVKTHFKGGWVEDKEFKDYYTNGCDFVMVTQHEIEE